MYREVVRKMKGLSSLARVLVVIGAINWGLAAMGWNLVENLLGSGMLTTWVYYLVGASGVWVAWEMWGGKKK